VFLIMSRVFKVTNMRKAWWSMIVIPATQEEEGGGYKVGGQPGQS
jgi:hypothetical protein